ncbi:hypothetical protein GLYMA_07G133300v4 [Glycine max]|uniref:DUF659 domain-containing protein n=1 Tax=Glycine max TaxID=3847 RepID=K7L1H3_SOYBN|nr:hypothetical protein GLYMA_07G133300v4 [Glycine max]
MSGTGIGNESVSSNANTGTSTSAASRSKNAPRNRTDIGWKHGTNVLGNGKKVKYNYCSKINNGGIFIFKHHLVGTRWDSDPCASVPEEVKMLMMNIVAKVANASEKRRKLNSIHEEGTEGVEVESNSSQSGIQRKWMLAFKGRGKSKFVQASGGEGVQATLNQLYKKGDKDKVDDQCAEFWYTSAIPFNVIKNPAFAKFCDMVGRYGVGYKPPSYHDIREKLLKRAVAKTDVMLQEFRDEWKKTDISKTTDKVLKMLDDVVDFVGEENVVQVITDNAANYKAAGELLMHKRENLYWTSCAAHCIDLIFEDFEKHFKVHQTTITKGRRITTYIYGRTMLISIMKKFTNGRDLIRPGMTRFATAYLTLACLHELKASLMSMFSSEEWKTSKFGTSQEERKVQNMALDSRFWKNVIMCLKVAAPLMVVLRLVDSDVKPAMGFIYEEMENAKEKIKCNFNNTKKKVKEGLHMCMRRLVKDAAERKKINLQHVEFHFARGLFSMEEAKDSRKIMQLGEWWEMFGDGTPELRRFAIRVLSLTCSSSGCDRNWSSFEMVHTMRRNRLQQKKMNDLVYVMYNLKLKSKQNRKSIALPFDEIESDNEWITEEGYNDEDEQPQAKGHGDNVELVGDVGGSSNDPVVDAFDIDKLIFLEPNDNDKQSEEDLDDDGDGDESGDIHGDDPIRGLDMLL